MNGQLFYICMPHTLIGLVRGVQSYNNETSLHRERFHEISI